MSLRISSALETISIGGAQPDLNDRCLILHRNPEISLSAAFSTLVNSLCKMQRTVRFPTGIFICTYGLEQKCKNRTRRKFSEFFFIFQILPFLHFTFYFLFFIFFNISNTLARELVRVLISLRSEK